MVTLKVLVNVETLNLGIKGFSGSRLEELAALPKLTHLWLGAYHDYVPAEHFSKLAGFPALRFLGIGGASDSHLAEIGRLSQIDSLSLFDLNAAATGTGLASLQSLDKLRSLTIYRTKLSPEHLAALARLTRLEQLELHDTDIDSAGVQRLTQALPKCKVQVTPPLADGASPKVAEPRVKE
ncbi:MAG: hypothetical protein FJ297_06910 [Planctomycetes bacterium]|nr:hypothetical protein [Planctomycetota bacterium]